MKKHIWIALLAWLLTASLMLCACDGGETSTNDGGETPPPNIEEIIPTEPSEGLEFSLNKEGDSYMLKGMGDCTDTYVVIPSTYEGKPVTKIGFQVFNRVNVTGVTIPEGIT